MGDGSLAAHDSENPYMRWNNTNVEFLEFLDEKLGWLTTGVRLKKTAEQAACQRLERNPEWDMEHEISVRYMQHALEDYLTSENTNPGHQQGKSGIPKT